MNRGDVLFEHVTDGVQGGRPYGGGAKGENLPKIVVHTRARALSEIADGYLQLQRCTLLPD